MIGRRKARLSAKEERLSGHRDCHHNKSKNGDRNRILMTSSHQSDEALDGICFVLQCIPLGWTGFIAKARLGSFARSEMWWDKGEGRKREYLGDAREGLTHMRRCTLEGVILSPSPAWLRIITSTTSFPLSSASCICLSSHHSLARIHCKIHTHKNTVER